MRKVIIALVITNIISLIGVWYFKHNYEGMVSLAEFSEKLHQECLMTTKIVVNDGYARVFATPTIFRTLEDCNKYETDWNANGTMGTILWHCEKYHP